MRRRGTVLATVLVVAALAATVAVSVLFLMRAEAGAFAAHARGEQAWRTAMSGLRFAAAVAGAHSGDSELWYDNPEIFQNQLVYDDGADRWHFTIYAENPIDSKSVRYGLEDEAAKLNINTADEETLAAFSPVPVELVDALLDWRDADDEPRSLGAEQVYYDQLLYPYLARNGRLRTLEEALLIKGFTGAVVYGEDANLNGLLDLNEDDGDDTFPPDDRDGALARGLYGLATVWSSEPNVDREGRARIDLNSEPDRLAQEGLSDPLVDFLRVYRAEGGTLEHPADLLEMEYRVQREHREFPDLRRGDILVADVQPEDLVILVDRTTTTKEETLVGLVNVNTAQVEVLAALPGMDESLARQIVDVRTGLDAEARSTIAWLYTTGVMDAEGFRRAAPSLTARSFQYRVRSIGFGARCGRYRIVEGVLDLTGPAPRLVYVRDLTRMGLPFALDAEAIQRSG
jgi:hypothetical protein